MLRLFESLPFYERIVEQTFVGGRDMKYRDLLGE